MPKRLIMELILAAARLLHTRCVVLVTRMAWLVMSDEELQPMLEAIVPDVATMGHQQPL